MKICQNCGAEVSDTAKFCRKCGAKIEAGATRFGQDAESQPVEEEAQNESESAETSETAGFDAAADRPFGQGAGTAEFVGTEYEWGPPTGGSDYDEPAMPAVLIRESGQKEPQQEDASRQSAYTYRIDAPGYDHTDQFDPEDISENKVTAMAAYLLGPLGVIIALLAGQDSPYAAFHMRQGLKFVVVEALLTVISLLLCWTLIVPAVASVLALILGVVKIIAFVSVCKGRAVEPAIIRSLKFLK